MNVKDLWKSFKFLEKALQVNICKAFKIFPLGFTKKIFLRYWIILKAH
jgi:hypothetical protein